MDRCRGCGLTTPGSQLSAAELCPPCHLVTDFGTGAIAESGPGMASPVHPVWSWSDPAGVRALRSREPGTILRAYRQANGLTQERLADLLGYDKTYISMIETGRRPVQDVVARRHIARVLSIPAHLLGVTDSDDTEFAAMLAFARSTIRLADLARTAGRATVAINELWPLVSQLETRSHQKHVDQVTMAVLAQAWISLGVCLGTVLPEERLWIAARWTAKGLSAARQLDHRATPGLLARALQMHGNELRKSGHPSTAIAVLSEAVCTAGDDGERGTALALLARAAGTTGNQPLYAQTLSAGLRLLDRHEPDGTLFNPFVWREIQLRALMDLGQNGAAIRLARDTNTAHTPAPAPQWTVIEHITVGDVLMSAGEHEHADTILTSAAGAAAQYRMAHQLQRITRIAQRTRREHLTHAVRACLEQICPRPAAAPDRVPSDAESTRTA